MDDRLLTIQYRCGSRRALEQIYVKYKRDLFLVALGLLNDTALAEDVVHDVFAAYFTRSRTYSDRNFSYLGC